MRDAEELFYLLKAVVKSGINVAKDDFKLEDFQDKKAEYYKKSIENNLGRLQSIDLSKCLDRANAKELIDKISTFYKQKKIVEMIPLVQELSKIRISYESPQKKIAFSIPNLPAEIKDDVNADLRELEKCFANECFRSSIILCGRILETALHRKYYDITGRDILETSPGIGLGNLIAKLKEHNFAFDPGISEQIHLINQVRIYSVHKKQNTFSPSKDQAQAIVLYTIDVVKKMF
ncbi:DUF4145 domain-containing protein [Candidatus Woesearchaeota archaeon]|nr:DUF4145 domain-containing protein [Candidatus Woesearchaeota archaeon]